MKSRIFFIILIFLLSFLPKNLLAGISENIVNSVETAYPPAIHHYGLDSAHDKVDSEKLRGFVVIEKNGLPAERARYFISWEDYDYRGVVVHLDKKDKITTRRSDIYTNLQRGDVMAVAGVKFFNTTIYLKLISADVYIPADKADQKHHSRVTLMLGLKFPKSILDEGSDAVLKKMTEWARPFSNLNDAKEYARKIEISGGDAVKVVNADEKVADDKKIEKSDENIKVLEDKIEDARKQLEDAQKELKQIKRTK